MKAANIFGDDLERAVEELAKTLDLVPEAPAPFASVKLTPAEQMQRFQAMGPDQWEQMLAERPWDEVLKYARRMQRRQEAENGMAQR